MEDQLSSEQRLRLECLAQANMAVAGRSTPSHIIAIARQFQSFVEHGTHLSDTAAEKWHAEAIKLPTLHTN